MPPINPKLGNQQLSEIIPDYFDKYENFKEYYPYFDQGLNISDTINDDEISNYKYIDEFNNKVKNNEKLLLACHDYKGNYLKQDTEPYMEYKHKINDNIDDGFPFCYPGMSYTDIFIYFSHKFISIPCKKWINQCRIHQKLILGTLLVEHENDRDKFYDFLDDDKASEYLSILLKIKNIDGLLLNIEITVDDIYITKLLNFIKNLKMNCKKLYKRDIPIIWYDSVTIDGKLDYQCSLTLKNEIFFNVSDYIFLDYKWTKEHYISTKNLCKNDNFNKIFFGIDMFARNTPSYNVGVDGVIQAINQLPNASIAIFAPGYHHENHDPLNDCNMTIMEIWKDFFIHFNYGKIILTTKLSLGSPYLKYEKTSDDDEYVFKLKENHVFPLFSETLPIICGNIMKFSNKTLYQIIHCPKKLNILVKSTIKNGYIEFIQENTNNSIKVEDDEISFDVGNYHLYMIPTNNSIMELHEFTIEPKL